MAQRKFGQNPIEYPWKFAMDYKESRRYLIIFLTNPMIVVVKVSFRFVFWLLFIQFFSVKTNSSYLIPPFAF